MSPSHPPVDKFREEVLIAGFGGQGILFLGQILAWGAFLAGREVTWLPSYGPEMRGGTANCMVVISDRRIVSPFVPSPRVAIILNGPSLLRFAPAVVPSGSLIVDRRLLPTRCERSDVQLLAIPASEMAREVGNERLANVVLAGVYAGLFPRYVDYEAGMAALGQLSYGGRAHLLATNRSAFARGYNYIAGGEIDRSGQDG